MFNISNINNNKWIKNLSFAKKKNKTMLNNRHFNPQNLTTIFKNQQFKKAWVKFIQAILVVSIMSCIVLLSLAENKIFLKEILISSVVFILAFSLRNQSEPHQTK